MLKTHVINYELMLGKFEDTLAKLFLTDKHMNYPWLNNIFVELNRCLDKTANWAVLEELSIDIYKEFEFIDKQIQTLDPNNKKLYIRILESYITVLQKLNIISKTNYDLLDDEAKILHSLKMRIIDQTIMNVAEKSIKNNIDAYGVEIITSYLIKLCQKSELNLVFATELAESLEKFCLDFLQTFNNSQKIPITCVQSHFSSLINLYCELMPESNLALLTLNSESYHILLHVLIFVIFEKKSLQFEDYSNMKSKMHPIRIYEYQQIILNQFIYLHSHENLNIPSKTIWKTTEAEKLRTHFLHSKEQQTLRKFLNVVTKSKKYSR
ncbi:uncharacterized protein LOC119666585 [Teleopsis dalmanni]|uniref:uncharacterized protein LOC119666585 n=1 Tax=Teleopsis dalmanni TaxID=139649 RepID=UPI0018CDDA80|nr:uncharacterized protein LOC119666585 [Teleopsis dalmanni]